MKTLPQEDEYRLQDVSSALSYFFSRAKTLARVLYWALDGSMARTKVAQE